MDKNFPKCLKRVRAHEGGFVNDPHDPGGATNKGITIGSYRAYVNPKGTIQDLKSITDAQVAQVYRREYWDAVRADDLPAGLDYAVFDFAVNSGPARAAKYLQRALKVTVDGKIGPVTIKAANAANPDAVIQTLCASRLAFLRKQKTWSRYKNGWTARVNQVLHDALADAHLPIITITDTTFIAKAPDVPPGPLPPAVPGSKSIWQIVAEALLGAFSK